AVSRMRIECGYSNPSRTIPRRPNSGGQLPQPAQHRFNCDQPGDILEWHMRCNAAIPDLVDNVDLHADRTVLEELLRECNLVLVAFRCKTVSLLAEGRESNRVDRTARCKFKRAPEVVQTGLAPLHGRLAHQRIA